MRRSRFSASVKRISRDAGADHRRCVPGASAWPWGNKKLTLRVWDRPNFLARGISPLDLCAVEPDGDVSSEDNFDNAVENNASTGNGSSGGSAHDCSRHNTRPNSADEDPPAPLQASVVVVEGGGAVINAHHEKLPFLVFPPQKIQVENRTHSDLDLLVLDDEIREAVIAVTLGGIEGSSRRD